MQIVDCGPGSQYIISDGAFVAATSSVELKVRTQSLGNACSRERRLLRHRDGRQRPGGGVGLRLDERCWTSNRARTRSSTTRTSWPGTATLRYEISITTGQSGGFLGNLINSQTSGEGIVLRFSGRGKIYVCSRNRAAFKAWMQAPAR
jgi:uncharacterized protein (AIM24 family)